MKLQGRAMCYAIFAFAGCALLFFGYDTSVMSQVNNNKNYQNVIGVAGGTGRDDAAIGGMVSLWFGGFAVGMVACSAGVATTR
jgi:hypothetical protein